MYVKIGGIVRSSVPSMYCFKIYCHDEKQAQKTKQLMVDALKQKSHDVELDYGYFDKDENDR